MTTTHTELSRVTRAYEAALLLAARFSARGDYENAEECMETAEEYRLHLEHLKGESQ